MQYRILGRTGVKVSPLCLGTMNFGGRSENVRSGTKSLRTVLSPNPSSPAIPPTLWRNQISYQFNPDLCRGCGACENACPALRAGKAIFVHPLKPQGVIVS